MAIFTPGPIVGAISGNLAGANFLQTRYGPVVRRALQRTDKHTEAQLSHRAYHLYVINAWSTLTTLQRDTWISAAAGITFPNRLGLRRHLSAFQLFTQYNHLRLADYPVATLAPIKLQRTPAPYSVGLIASASTTITVSWSNDAPPGDSHFYFYGARSFSTRPAHHFKNWRYITYTTKAPGNWNHGITAQWDPILGHPVLGELVAVKIRAHHKTSLSGFPVQVSDLTVV